MCLNAIPFFRSFCERVILIFVPHTFPVLGWWFIILPKAVKAQSRNNACLKEVLTILIIE